MPARDTNAPTDATALALAALAWTLGEQPRAERLLGVTGLTAGDLRARAADPQVLSAVLGFLAAHEPDLVACAAALGVDPAALMAAADHLETT